MLTLTIDSTDRSDWIDWESLYVSQALTRQPDTMDFTIKLKDGRTAPSLGASVVLAEDGTDIFSGVLVERKEVVVGGLLQAVQCSVKDHTQTLDKFLVSQTYEDKTAKQIIDDILANYTDGTFTGTNIATDTPTIETARFNYETVSRSLSLLADQIGYDWYVDVNKDIHFFKAEGGDTVLTITDTSQNFDWKTLEINRNIIELVNSVIVRGGEYKSAISETNARDVFEGDGTTTMYTLGYKYNAIQVKVGGVAQTVGVDNITDPTTVDVLYNFSEKFLRFTTAPTDGDSIVVYGNAYIPVIARVRDTESIATYGGEYQDIVIDKSITSIAEAQSAGKAKLLEWGEGQYNAIFKTRQKGLVTGDRVAIQSTIRGVNDTYKINRISARAINANELEYTVQLLKSGEITFADIIVDLLGEKKRNIIISDDETVQRLETIRENDITITDKPPTITQTSPPYLVGSTAVVGYSTIG